MSHLRPQLIDALLERPCNFDEQSHLDQCALCRHNLADRRAIVDAIRSAAVVPASPQHIRNQALRLQKSLRQPAPAPSKWLFALPLGSAALVAVAGLVLLLTPPSTSNSAQAVRPDTVPVVGSPLPRSPVAALPALKPGSKLDPPSSSSLVIVPKQQIRARSPQNDRSKSPVKSRPVVAKWTKTQSPAAPEVVDVAHKAQIFPENSWDIEDSPGLAAPTAQDVALAVAAAQRPVDPGPQIEAAFKQLESARSGDAQHRHLIRLQRLLIAQVRSIDPIQLEMNAHRIAGLALKAPEDEIAAHLACELGLQSARFESAYRLCSTYLERFPQGPHARDVAFLSGTVARTQLGDCRAAIERYGQAITFSGLLRSYDDQAYLGRAMCRAQLGDLEGARGDLDLYLHKRPLARQDKDVKELLRKIQPLPIP